MTRIERRWPRETCNGCADTLRWGACQTNTDKIPSTVRSARSCKARRARDRDRRAAVSLFRRDGILGVAGASGAGRGGLRGDAAVRHPPGHDADHVRHLAAGGRSRTARVAIPGCRRRAVPGERLCGQFRAGRGAVAGGRAGLHRRDGARFACARQRGGSMGCGGRRSRFAIATPGTWPS